MPVNNGVIYSTVEDGIKIGVSVDDVHDCLGESSYDIGTLCMSSKINKWAKFKPEAFDQPGDLTELQRKTNNFGLSLSTIYTNKTNLINGLKKGGGSWVYTRPSAAMMKRITDFDGYDHNAVSPFGAIVAQDVMLADGPVIDFVMPISGTGSLSLADFEASAAPLKQWYVSILLYNDFGEWLASSERTFAQGNSWQVNFDGSIGLKKGDYTAVPFICSARWVPGATSGPSSFKACGIQNNGVVIHILSQQDRYTITIVAQWNSAKTIVSYTISIYNGSNAASNFPNVKLLAAKSNQGTDEYVLKKFGSFSLGAGKTWTHSANVSLSTAYTYLGVRYDGLSNVTWYGIREHIIINPDA